MEIDELLSGPRWDPPREQKHQSFARLDQVEEREGDTMFVVRATAMIRNPADLDQAWEGELLVGTGAMDSLVPRRHLEAIGLKPKGHRIYETADGSEVLLDFTTAEVEIMGQIAGATILFGENDTDPLLGVTVLQSARIAIDPSSQSLYKRRIGRL